MLKIWLITPASRSFCNSGRGGDWYLVGWTATLKFDKILTPQNLQFIIKSSVLKFIVFLSIEIFFLN